MRPSAVGFVQRGLGYWTDGTVERVLVGTIDAYLLSIDARTGTPDQAFGDGGKVDLLVNVPRANRSTRQVTARRQLDRRSGAQQGDAARRGAGVRRAEHLGVANTRVPS